VRCLVMVSCYRVGEGGNGFVVVYNGYRRVIPSLSSGGLWW